MSQSAFLEEVITWNQEKRVEKVNEAIPKLVAILHTHRNFEEAIGILQIMCQAFVPLLHQDQLEDQIFSKIAEQVCQLVDGVLESIRHTWQEYGKNSNSDLLASLLQAMVSILECTEDCVKHVASLQDAVQLSHIRSLPRCTLHILKGSYEHCKESSELYGDFLPTIAHFLSAIFRKAHSLQVVFLNLLEKVDAHCAATSEDSQTLVIVCDGLFSLCRIVAFLDLKLTLSLWKAISRTASQHQVMLCEMLDISSMVIYLCGEMHHGIDNLLQAACPADDQETVMLSQGDEKTFTRALKILSFQMKVLVALARDFHTCLGDGVSHIYDLVLHLYRIFPPCLSAPHVRANQQEEISHLVKGACTLSSHLLSSKIFRDCLLEDEGTPEENYLPRMLLQIWILDNLTRCSEKLEELWFQRPLVSSGLGPGHQTLLSAVFRSLELCHVEVCLPVYLPSSSCTDGSIRNISLYQYVLEHLCAFLRLCSDRIFKLADKELLSFLIKMHPTTSLMAADCFYFIARSGSPALRWHYVHLLMSLNQDFHRAMPVGHSISSLSSVVSRLIKVLSPDQQVKLLSLFPPADNLGLWADVNLENMASHVAGDVVEALVPCCLKALHNFCQQTTPTFSHAISVIPCLKCLENILRHGSTARYLTTHQGVMLLELLSALWTMCPVDVPLTDRCNPGHEITQLFLAELLSATASVVDQFDNKLLLKVLHVVSKAVKESPYDGFALTVAHFLQQLGPVKLSPSFEQNQILRKIADTFATILTHEKGEVQHCAMLAFTKFAEQTSHEAVVPECLAQHEGLKERMVAFLQRIPHGHEDKKFDVIAFLKQQKQDMERKMARDLNTDPGSCVQFPVHSTEPLRKRQRLDSGSGSKTEVYQAAMMELEKVTATVEQLQMYGPIPDWVKTTASPLLHRLSACLSSRQ